MGQPTHALTAHVGKSQLWTLGTLCTPQTKLYSQFIYRAKVALRVIALMFVRPLLPNTTNLWHTNTGPLSKLLKRTKKYVSWVAFPDLTSYRRISNRYFRQLPDQDLFRDENGKMLIETGYLYKTPTTRFAWAKVRLYFIHSRAFFILKGVPFAGRRRRHEVSARKGKKQASFMWYCLYSFLSGFVPLNHGKKNNTRIAKAKSGEWF